MFPHAGAAVTETVDSRTRPDLRPPRDVVWIAGRLIDAG